MNALLGSLLVLGTFITLCNAQCFIIPQEASSSGECRDYNGDTHAVNSMWKTNDCYDCFCKPDAINCCGNAATPVNYDTRKCMTLFNQKKCQYKVVERNNPEKTCEVGGWVL